MDATLSRIDREAAIRDFGNTRILEAINRLYRKHGFAILTDEVLSEMIDGLEVDRIFSERLAAENRAIAAAATDPAETRRVVADVSAKITQALIERLAS